MTEKAKHHHGDLRAALVQSGVALIAADGPDALSIRKVAAAAGVSHAAPAHHFPSLAHLRTAVVAEGYRLFTAAMEAELAKAASDPKERLLAACAGYLNFALQHSSLFQLMHGGSPIHRDDEEFCRSAGDSYAVLRRVCASVEPGPAGAEGVEAFVWSLIHGYSMLTLHKEKGMFSAKDPHATFRAMFPDLPYKNQVN
ncbi:MAG: TetR/AcrR family transcriptional regulator [Neomegalonema sp.]|nr:TetR/AcrR family transcriptional regulator [Neomegalonema sp.]